VTDLKTQLQTWLATGLAAVAPGREAATIVVERPKQALHGDYATNVALQHAKALGRNPREFAQALVAALPPSPLVARTEIAGPGFVNVFLAPAARQAVVARILADRDRYGRSDARRRERVMVEFVSANPTGPLHVGHGRQAALGDALSTLFEWQGAEVTREFYYNDAGQQIQNLAISVRARAQELLGEHVTFPEDGYLGEYIRELAQRYLDEVGHDLGDIESIRRFAVAELRREQDRDLQAFGVRFDHYYLESSLYTDGRVEATVDRLACRRRRVNVDEAGTGDLDLLDPRRRRQRRDQRLRELARIAPRRLGELHRRVRRIVAVARLLRALERDGGPGVLRRDARDGAGDPGFEFGLDVGHADWAEGRRADGSKVLDYSRWARGTTRAPPRSRLRSALT
jgi:arginyl-tRNA synthetase